MIDTPGYGPRTWIARADLAAFVSTRMEVATHLILTASMKSADLTHVAERFKIFRPSSLLLTRVDETVCFGTAFSLPLRLGRPLSFPATGQELRRTLRQPSKERILGLLWPQTPGAQRLAA